MTVILWALGILAVLYLILSLVIFMLACRRFSSGFDPMRPLTHATDKLLAPYAGPMQTGKHWLESHPSETVELTSFDGLKLRGTLYENPEAKALAIFCHGYRSGGVRDFAPAAPFYYDRGMSLLLIDQRAAGRSQGKYITFGVRESRDARDWCALMAGRYPGLPILLGGLSLGAATVMMASDDLPKAVTALLADCGYTSPRQEFSFVAKHYMGAASVVLLPGVALWCRMLGGFGLSERSAAESLSRCALPVLFIHGEADGLVPYGCTAVNMAACRGPARLFSVAGADHGMSYFTDTEGYRRTVTAFLAEYLKV